VNPRYAPLAEFYGRCATRKDPAQQVGWRGHWDQELRFEALLEVIPPGERGFSILDVGCGLGHLWAYLRRVGIEDVDYLGIDVLPDMVAGARALYPEGRFEKLDLLSPELPADRFDYVVCSGALNVGVAGEHRLWTEQMLTAMWRHTRRALAVNALDATGPHVVAGATGTASIRRMERDWLTGVCRSLTARLVVREDVLPGELVVWCYRGPSTVVSRWRSRAGTTPTDVALAHLEHGLFEEALEVLDEVEDDTPDVVNLRAVALLLFGDHDTACHLLRGVLAEAPDHLGARRNLASGLAMGGDERAAIAQWRRVLDRSPHDDHTRAAICKALLRLGEVEAAVREARRIEDEPVRDLMLEVVGA